MNAGGSWKLYIITGLSGAGKSQALKIFEDFGFFCVDNLPVALIGAFVDRLWWTREDKKVALGLDVRGKEFLKGVPELLASLRERGIDSRIFFLDAADEALVQRFSETRHRHPLGRQIARAIREERRSLTEVQGLADKIIDTTNLTLGELKEKISMSLGMTQTREVKISLVSFGYKHGIPRDADIVMDVRFLPNPHYQPKLKPKTGLDKGVARYILKDPFTKKFLRDYGRLVKSLLPHYVREGKTYLTLAIGCTGGKHRSVFVTHEMAGMLEKNGYKATEYHRDVRR